MTREQCRKIFGAEGRLAWTVAAQSGMCTYHIGIVCDYVNTGKLPSYSKLESLRHSGKYFDILQLERILKTIRKERAET